MVIQSSDDDEAAKDDDDWKAGRKCKQRPAAEADFFLSPAERKRRKREADAAALSAVQAREAEAAVERARQAEAAALRREESIRDADRSLYSGRPLHGFFTLPRPAVPPELAARGGEGRREGGGSSRALPPVHVGWTPAAGIGSGVDAPCAWPPGLLLSAPPPPASTSVRDWECLAAALGLECAASTQCERAALEATEAETETEEERALRQLCDFMERASQLAESAGDAETQTTSERMTELRHALSKARAERAQVLLQGGETEEAGLWSRLHAPRCAADLVCAGDGAWVLRDWLASWKALIQGQPGAPPPPPSIQPSGRGGGRRWGGRARRGFVVDDDEEEGCGPDDWGDFVGEGSEDAARGSSGEEGLSGDEGGSALCTAMLLSGPPGCGKSAAAYAAAAELGFSVIEVGANGKRGGADILGRFGEATQSRRLAQGGGGGRPAPPAVLFAQPPLRQGSGVPAPPRSRAAVLQDDSESDGGVVVMGEAAAPSPEAAMSAILFDEAELLWGEDRGFTDAISKLAASAKCPLILTANSASSLLHLLPSSRLAHASLHRPDPSDYAPSVCRLCLVAMAERRPCSPAQALSALRSAGGDMRRALMQLQLQMAGGGKGALLEGKLEGAGKEEVAAFEAMPAALPKAGSEPPSKAQCAWLAALAAAADASLCTHLAWLTEQSERRETERASVKERARAAKAALRAAAKRKHLAAEVEGGAPEEEVPAEPEAKEPVSAAPDPTTADMDATEAPAQQQSGENVEPPWQAQCPPPAAPPRPPAAPSANTMRELQLLESVAELSGRLSDAAALRSSARAVGVSGPAPVSAWAHAVQLCSPLGEADEEPDASSPDAGADGGEPRSQRGGGPGVGELAAGWAARQSLRLGVQACAQGAAMETGPDAAIARCAEPEGGLPGVLRSLRTLLVVEVGIAGAGTTPWEAISMISAFAARIAHLEADREKHVLGKRRGSTRRGRSLSLSKEARCTLGQLSDFRVDA